MSGFTPNNSGIIQAIKSKTGTTKAYPASYAGIIRAIIDWDDTPDDYENPGTGGASLEYSTLVYDSQESSIWLGEKAPVRDPRGAFGWYFTNEGGNKIQWKIWTQQRSSDSIFKLQDIASVSLVLKARGIHYPFIQVYTKKKNDGLDAASWYRSRISYSTTQAPVNSDGRVFLTSDENTPIYKNLKRVALAEGAGPQSEVTEVEIEALPKMSVGPAEPDEEIKEISVATGSNEPDGNFDFTLSNLVIHTNTGIMTALLNGNDDMSAFYTKAEIDELLAAKADA